MDDRAAKPPESQPPRPQAKPDDVKNYESGTIFGQMANAFKSGWNHAARFATSLAVGTSDPQSGSVGAITSTGAVAGYYAYDRGGSPGNYIALYRDGTNFYLYSTESGSVISVNATTGTVTFIGKLLGATTIRTGTNATYDANVGSVIASGANAGLYAFDQTGGNNYAYLYRNGAHIYLASENGTLWDIDPATGYIAQPAWNTVTPNNTWTAFFALAYRVTKPGNEVVWRGSIQPGASGLGVSFFTMPTGARPTQAGQWAVAAANAGTPVSAYVSISGLGVMTVNAPAGTTDIYLDSLRWPHT